MSDKKLYWGDSHFNIRIFQEDKWEEAFAEASERLDFLPIAYYPFQGEWVGPSAGRAVTNDRGDEQGRPDDALAYESTGDRPLFQEQWAHVNEITAAFNQSGSFVTFPGFEWHGDRRKWGDHNAFYPEEGHPLLDTPDLPELVEELRSRGGFAFPHHTAYAPGERAKNWTFHDPEICPLAEVYSSHGCSEAIDSPVAMDRNRNMGPRTSGGTLVEGLLAGHKFGIMASSDAHYGYAAPWGRGLMAVYAGDLTREGIMEAIKARRAYGVTGDRIQLEFTADGAFMGEDAVKSDGPVVVRWKVVGCDAIDRVEVIHNGRVKHVYSHRGKWSPAGSGRAKVRFEAGWGPDKADGFKTPVKYWDGGVAVSDGSVVSVEPCFTTRGNRVFMVDDAAQFKLTTHQRDTRERDTGVSQAAVFEITYEEASYISLRVDGAEDIIPVQDLFNGEHFVADYAGIKRIVEEQFGVTENDLPNQDVYYHNAWKHRLQRAVPESGYTVEGEFADENPLAGESFYYIRVIQENGQAAWSSPVWVHR